MGQVGRDGASEELFDPSPYAAAPTADDDHRDIEDVG
jgi:hypothetical protein